jgi:hypothetical protein
VTIPGLVRLSDLEARVEQLEQRLAVLARFADPTATCLTREDRDAIVAYAASTRREEPDQLPADPPAGGSPPSPG